MAWRSTEVSRARSGVELIGQVYLRYYGTSTIPRYLYQAAAAFS